MRNVVDLVKRSIAWRRWNLNVWDEGEDGLKVRNHRLMVGGMWKKIGELQFRFLVDEVGLKRNDVFCDVACGSFRAGRLLIPYLDPGHYLGIDKQEGLVREGREKEIPKAVWEKRRPEIIISDQFEFHRFSKRPTKAIAQSLFTHLTKRDIRLCMQRLFEQAAPGCEFYATFNETETPPIYTLGSHSSRAFKYRRDTMLGLGEACGWQVTYIGDWKHPRGQMMLKLVKPEGELK